MQKNIKKEAKKVLEQLQNTMKSIEQKETLFKKTNEGHFFSKRNFDASVRKLIAEKDKAVLQMLDLLHKERESAKSWVSKIRRALSKTYRMCLQELQYNHGVDTNKVVHFNFSFQDLKREYKTKIKAS